MKKWFEFFLLISLISCLGACSKNKEGQKDYQIGSPTENSLKKQISMSEAISKYRIWYISTSTEEPLGKETEVKGILFFDKDKVEPYPFPKSVQLKEIIGKLRNKKDIIKYLTDAGVDASVIDSDETASGYHFNLITDSSGNFANEEQIILDDGPIIVSANRAGYPVQVYDDYLGWFADSYEIAEDVGGGYDYKYIFTILNKKDKDKPFRFNTSKDKVKNMEIDAEK